MALCWEGFWAGGCAGGSINQSCPCGGRQGLLTFVSALRLVTRNGTLNRGVETFLKKDLRGFGRHV